MAAARMNRDGHESRQGREQERAAMVSRVAELISATSWETGVAELDPRVRAALQSVPRHRFVPEYEQRLAYADSPLPIGYAQTISQPFIVALMTQLAALSPSSRVLEIGTGSGYQAAVLAELNTSVWSIEIIEALGRQAQARLRRLGYDNIEVRLGDGYYGWTEHAPFDAIVVTAAANHIPPPLLNQLKPGGKMIIPVGSRFSTQQLILITRGDNDEFTTRQVLPVRFVPLTGEH